MSTPACDPRASTGTTRARAAASDPLSSRWSPPPKVCQSAGPVRSRHLISGPAVAAGWSPQQGEKQDWQPKEESPAARQYDTNDHEQRAGNGGHGPPTGPQGSYEPRHADDREQRAGTQPPSDRPGSRALGEGRVAVSVGWAAGQAPGHQVPAMCPHSHDSPLYRRKPTPYIAWRVPQIVRFPFFTDAPGAGPNR